MIQLPLFVLLLAALAFCFACNRDTFSPAKFYHAFLCVFFADIFLSEHDGCIYAIYLGFILVGMLLSLFEAFVVLRVPAMARPIPSRMLPARFVLVLWALSTIPVLAQVYLIHLTGGLASLVTVIAHRVMEWQGLGPLIMLIKVIAPINLVYFAVGLIYTKRRAATWWLMYSLHLLLFAVIALLQGSRGFVLLHLLFMVVVYHYLRRPVRLRYALAGGVSLIVIAAFLGTVRNNLSSLKNLESLSDMQGDTLNLAMFSYGTTPLEAVFSREFTEYQYGRTFLTPITNFIPRRIWPQKFESGGVVLTKFLKGHRYTGLSNTSPGLVAEGILNFGYPLGVVSGFACLLFLMIAVVRFYGYFRNRISQCGSLYGVWLTGVYAYGGSMIGGLLFGEFQNYVGGLLINLILLEMVISALRLRLIPFRILRGAATPGS